MESLPRDVVVIVYRYVFDYYYAMVRAEYSRTIDVSSYDNGCAEIYWKGVEVNFRQLTDTDHNAGDVYIRVTGFPGYKPRCKLPNRYKYSNGTWR